MTDRPPAIAATITFADGESYELTALLEAVTDDGTAHYRAEVPIAEFPAGASWLSIEELPPYSEIEVYARGAP